jgi:hypothetical protein
MIGSMVVCELLGDLNMASVGAGVSFAVLVIFLIFIWALRKMSGTYLVTVCFGVREIGVGIEVSFLELITASQVPSGSSLLAEIYSDTQNAFPY